MTNNADETWLNEVVASLREAPLVTKRAVGYDIFKFKLLNGEL